MINVLVNVKTDLSEWDGQLTACDSLSQCKVDGWMVGGHHVLPILISLTLMTLKLDKAGCFV